MTESMPPPPAAPPPMAPPPMAPPPMGPAAAARPMGATVITIIEAILGVFLLLAAIAAIGLGSLAGGLVGSSGVEGGAAAAGILAGLGIFFGIIALALAILYFAIAYGVWKARSWAWMLGVVVSIIGLVFGVLGLSGGITLGNLVSLALPIVVLYFFWQPDVKRYLGRPA
jgi:hypothetical protein